MELFSIRIQRTFQLVSTFPANSSFLRKSNWQEKPSYEAVPTAVHRIRKTSKRFRQRKEPKVGKEKTT